MRHYSTYILRLQASYDKWKDRRVRLLRAVVTKGGTKFSPGEVLRVCGVSSPGKVDLSDDSRKGRMVINIPLRDIEVVGDMRDRVFSELQSSGKGFTVAELARKVGTPYASVRYVLKKLVEKGRVVEEEKKYRWVLPKKRGKGNVWERISEND